MSGWSRRAVLGGLAGGISLGGLFSCGDPPPDPPAVGVLGAARAARGHRLRAPFTPGSPGQRLRPAVCVVGGGVAGLSLIWRLRRAGFAGEIVLVELDEVLGGTSQAGGSAAAPLPGAASPSTNTHPNLLKNPHRKRRCKKRAGRLHDPRPLWPASQPPSR